MSNLLNPAPPNPETTTLPTETADSNFEADQIFTIAGGHFINDTYSAFVTPLLPLLQERFTGSRQFLPSYLAC